MKETLFHFKLIDDPRESSACTKTFQNAFDSDQKKKGSVWWWRAQEERRTSQAEDYMSDEEKQLYVYYYRVLSELNKR